MGSRVRKVWRGFGARGCLGLSVYMCGISAILRFSLECLGFRVGEG